MIFEALSDPNHCKILWQYCSTCFDAAAVCGLLEGGVEHPFFLNLIPSVSYAVGLLV